MYVKHYFQVSCKLFRRPLFKASSNYCHWMYGMSLSLSFLLRDQFSNHVLGICYHTAIHSIAEPNIKLLGRRLSETALHLPPSDLLTWIRCVPAWRFVLRKNISPHWPTFLIVYIYFILTYYHIFLLTNLFDVCIQEYWPSWRCGLGASHPSYVETLLPSTLSSWQREKKKEKERKQDVPTKPTSCDIVLDI